MNKISMMTLALSAALAFSACKKEPENAEGPMEAAGEEVDQTAADVSEASDETAEEAGEEMEEAGEALEE